MKNVIFETGGKQYRASEGEILFIEKLDLQNGETVKFDKVLALIDDEDSKFGAPYLEGVSVTANIIKTGKGKKIRVFKKKPKKGYERTQGHRQPYTKIQIESIS